MKRWLAGALLVLAAGAWAQTQGTTANPAIDSARGTAAKEDAERRARSAPGALPPMDMRIQGDGIAVPGGVGRKAQEEAEIAREAAEEKARQEAKDAAKR